MAETITLSKEETVERTKSTDDLVKKANAWLAAHEKPSWFAFFEGLEVTDDFAEEYVNMLHHTHKSEAALDHRLWGHILDATRCMERAAKAQLGMLKTEQRIDDVNKGKKVSWQSHHYHRTPQGKYESEWIEVVPSIEGLEQLYKRFEGQWLKEEASAHYLWQVCKLLRARLVYL